MEVSWRGLGEITVLFAGGWALYASIAAGLGVLLSILPLVAAVAEAVMLTLFTTLVWIPAVVAAPHKQLPWTAFIISWAISAGAWVVVAGVYRELTEKPQAPTAHHHRPEARNREPRTNGN